MSRFILSTMIVFFTLPSFSTAEELVSAEAKADAAKAPVEKSFFESRTLEDIQQMVKFDAQQFEQQHSTDMSSSLGS